ncbi:acyl-CoA dehydrogenase [Streptomyces massasporeus]
MTTALLPGHLPSGTVLFPPAGDSCRTERTARTPQAPPSALSAELTRLLFDGERRTSVHAAWRALLTDERFHHRPDLAPEQRAALSYERLRQVNEVIDSPEQLARDPERLAALHEWTGVVDGGLCTLASIHYNLFLGSLLDHDPAGRDLSEFTSMRRTGTFLCTELDHGNDAPALETTAELDPTTGGFVLNTPTAGAQKFMPNTSLTGGPKSAVVAARLLIDGHDQGVHLFLTPLSDDSGHLPGIRVTRLPQRTGTPVDHCLTAFDHVRLPREALLQADHGRLDDQNTFTTTLGSPRKRFLKSIDRVTTGKLCMSAGTLGMARASLAIAVRHAHTRHISGPRRGVRVPLMAHRSHHSRLLNCLALAYAMSFLHRSVLTHWNTHHPEQRDEAARLVAIAKGWITWHARTITTESRERCGAQGLLPHNGIADLTSHIEGGITAEGDNLVIWLKAASEMLFENQTHNHNPNHNPSHTQNQNQNQNHSQNQNQNQNQNHSQSQSQNAERPTPTTSPTPTDPTPAGPAPADPADRALTDLQFLRELLAHTVTGWQTRARDALRSGPKGDPLGRWNEASTPALEMISAYATLKATDAFTNATTHTQNPETRHILEDLCRLFLLHQLTPHTALLLADNHITPHHVHTQWTTINDLTTRLAPHTQTLTDAFDLPTEYLTTLPLTHHHPTTTNHS